MATPAKLKDYSSYAAEVNQIDVQAQHLLDELVNTLQRSPGMEELEDKAARLATQAAKLADETESTDEMDVNEKTVMLETLCNQAEHLLQTAPDAVICGEQEKWSDELEAISSHLHSVRESLSLLALPHLTPSQRANHEKRARALLTASKLRLRKAHEGIRLRSHVGAHPVVANLLRMHKAMGGVRKQWGLADERARQERLSASAKQAGGEMKAFFQHELNGRLFVDSHTVQMRSSLTGMVRQWPHDAVTHAALMQLVAGTDIARLLTGVAGRKTSLAAQFECQADVNGLVVELQAGERTIMGDTILYKPVVARISV